MWAMHWNNLPINIRSLPDKFKFKKALKTILFQEHYGET